MPYWCCGFTRMALVDSHHTFAEDSYLRQFAALSRCLTYFLSWRFHGLGAISFFRCWVPFREPKAPGKASTNCAGLAEYSPSVVPWCQKFLSAHRYSMSSSILHSRRSTLVFSQDMWRHMPTTNRAIIKLSFLLDPRNLHVAVWL